MSRESTPPMPLTELIAAEIAAAGPLPFDRFMDLALYHPELGFYGAGRLRSDRGGDFLTSPEVSPLFGETVAAFVTAERELVGGLDGIVECGAGSGSLLEPVTAAFPDVSAWAVEVSPAARNRLGERLPGVTVVASLAEVPVLSHGVVVANELLDNLPAAVAVRTGDGWVEEGVGVSGGRLVPVQLPARDEVVAWAEHHAGNAPVGTRVEVQLAAAAWLDEALGHLRRGVVVVVDYGDSGVALRSNRPEGTVRTYRAHHLGPDPLAEPGATDITLDVDFAALAGAASDRGARVEVTTQADFLTRWGLGRRLGDLRSAELAAARSGATMERLMLRSRVTEAETLLHPRGLGDFRVLVARVGEPGAGVGDPV